MARDLEPRGMDEDGSRSGETLLCDTETVDTYPHVKIIEQWMLWDFTAVASVSIAG